MRAKTEVEKGTNATGKLLVWVEAPLLVRARQLVEKGFGGYRSVSELVRDALRRRLEELEALERDLLELAGIYDPRYPLYLPLFERARHLVELNAGGYKSTSELERDALRRRVEELERRLLARARLSPQPVSAPVGSGVTAESGLGSVGSDRRDEAGLVKQAEAGGESG